MSRESVLSACLVLLVSVGIPPPVAEANSPWESAYLFPVAASANGAGGTVWKTELCLTNPWELAIEIVVGTVNSDQQPVSFRLTLSGDETECFSDIVETMGLPVGHSNFLAVFSEDALEFFASSRIYNTSLNGEYGQTVEPAGDNNPFGFMQPGDLAAFTGIKNYGTAGGAGYRTNLGIFNFSDDEIVVEVVECKNPSVCKFYELAVPAQSTVQKPMRSNDFTEGYIAVLTPDYISAYTSTVNNKSGDAVFQGHRIVTLSASKDAGRFSSQLAPLLERIEVNTKSNGSRHDFKWHFDRLRERLSAGEHRNQPE